MRRIIRVIGLVLALCGAAFAGNAPAGAAGSRSASEASVVPAGFSAPHMVVHGVFDWLSEVVDSTNHVHIAATGRGGLWYLTNRTGTWSAHRILVSLHNKSYFDPSIALDDNDRVYIAVVRQSCDNCAPGGSDGIFFVSDKGRTRGTFPSSPSRIGPNHSGAPSLKVSSGHIYLVYEKICCLPGDPFKVILKTNATGPWTTSPGDGWRTIPIPPGWDRRARAGRLRETAWHRLRGRGNGLLFLLLLGAGARAPRLRPRPPPPPAPPPRAGSNPTHTPPPPPNPAPPPHTWRGRGGGTNPTTHPVGAGPSLPAGRGPRAPGPPGLRLSAFVGGVGDGGGVGLGVRACAPRAGRPPTGHGPTPPPPQTGLSLRETAAQRQPTSSRFARLASSFLTPRSGNATVTSSSSRVSFDVTTVPSPNARWRTRSPSR